MVNVATSSTSSAMLAGMALTSTTILSLPHLSSADATAAGSLNLNADYNMDIGRFLTQLHTNNAAALTLNTDLHDNENENGDDEVDVHADTAMSFDVFNTNVSLHTIDAANVNETHTDTVYHHHQQQQHQQYAAKPIVSNDEFDSHLIRISARESNITEMEINSEGNEVLELELPKEVADLIIANDNANDTAQSTSTSTTPQQEKEEYEPTSESIESTLPAALAVNGNNKAVRSQYRYYATYSPEEPCSSKSASEFELWEESYDSLKECCEVNFGWEFDSCVGIL